MSKVFSENPVKITNLEQLVNLKKRTVIEITCPNCQKIYQTHVYTKIGKPLDKIFLCKTCSYKKTCLEKFGVDNVFKTTKVKEIIKSRSPDWYEERNTKVKQTKIEKFGSLEKAKEVMWQHQRETMQRKYGVDNIFKDKEYIEKCTVEKLGRRNVFCGEEGKKIAEEGMLKKHGVRRAFQKEEFKEKYKQTSRERFGVDNFGMTEEHTKKMQETNLKKFGTIHAPSHNYTFEGQSFDSSWELAFYVYCKDCGMNIVREPTKLEYLVEDRKRHYVPDFEVDGKLYEIKGNHFLNNGKLTQVFDKNEVDLLKVLAAKDECMKRNQVILISDKEIKKYLNYVKEVYGKDFLQNCRKN